MNENLKVALDWLDAVTRRDTERLISLSDADIELRGPHGVGSGIEVLQQWLATVRLRVSPREGYIEDDQVAIVHDMDWLDAGGQVSASLRNFTFFTLRGGLVTSMERDDEPEALPRHGFGDALPHPVTPETGLER